jgi:hypothetical protein
MVTAQGRKRIPHSRDLHPGLAGYVPLSVDCVARGRDRINLRRAGALAGRLSSPTFGGLLFGFRLRRRSLRCLERISISEGHVERTSPAGPRSRIRVHAARASTRAVRRSRLRRSLTRLGTSRSMDRNRARSIDSRKGTFRSRVRLRDQCCLVRGPYQHRHGPAGVASR